MAISANRRCGVEVVDRAHDNVIFHTKISTNALGTQDLGNALGGIYPGSGTSSTVIGGPSSLRNLVRSNGGNGVT